MSGALIPGLRARWARLFVTAAAVALFGVLPGGDSGEVRGAGKKKAKVAGISRESYETLFLDDKDMPDWKKGQDTRHRSADPNDKTFGKLGGLHTGLVVWQKRSGQKFERAVDIRWVFPSAKAAREYLKDQLSAIGEGLPRVKNAPKLGAECYAFGGAQDLFEKSRSYIIAFRQGNVVVKYFQFESGADAKLRPLKMAPTCLKIVKRIKAAAR